jgi:hypothetical protein
MKVPIQALGMFVITGACAWLYSVEHFAIFLFLSGFACGAGVIMVAVDSVNGR